MHKIVINGNFYNDRLTGIERFAHEITKRLDKISNKDEIALLLFKNFPNTVPNFKNIKKIIIPKTPYKKLYGIKLNFYKLFSGSIILDFANRTPLFGNNIVFLHDIYCRVFQQDFISPKDKIIMKKNCRMYERIAKKAKLIFTVSEFSKKQIIEYYNIPEKKISVIYNGWEHIKDINSDESIFTKLLELENKEFYFTLGSLSLRKNLKWIAEHAALYPDEFFVISGTILKNVIPPELEKLKTLKNVILTGYLTDGQVKALMQKCKAFVLPSYFEGFGIPPLEALACKVPIIIANASCLPEIYGKTAHYIDPFNPDIDLNELLKEPVEKADEILKKYSFDSSAKQLYKILKEL